MSDALQIRSSAERDKPHEEKTNYGDNKKSVLDSEGIGFQMRPNVEEKFNHSKVESVIESSIRDYMSGKEYSNEDAEEWCTQLSNLINSKVKDLHFPRYKIITIVTMGEQIGGGIHIGMKCLWDADTDAYANFSYMSVIIANVFGHRRLCQNCNLYKFNFSFARTRFSSSVQCAEFFTTEKIGDGI